MSRVALRLARWLGPWASPTLPAPGVERQTITLPRRGHIDDQLTVWRYTPTRVERRGTLLIVPGLHFLGPNDPRLARVAHAMAASGITAYVPFLPACMNLKLDPSTIGEVSDVFDTICESEAGRVGVFTISFGSALGALMTQHIRTPERLGGLVLFGGFAHWKETLAYSISDRDLSAESVPPDPLNQPVLFLNLAPHLGLDEGDTERLQRAWMTYIQSTWGPPLNATQRQADRIARDLAYDLPQPVQSYFLKGCGVRPGGRALIRPLFADESTLYDWLDTREALRALECPIHVVHGASDNVIPIREGQALYEWVEDRPSSRCWFTGLYGHTGIESLDGGRPSPRMYARELRTMWGVINAISEVGRR